MSGTFIAYMGLKIPVKQLETIDDLFATNIIPVSSTRRATRILSQNKRISNNEFMNYNFIKAKKLFTERHKAVPMSSLVSDIELLKGVVMKKYAIFHNEVHINTLIANCVKRMESECKLKYLSESFDNTAYQTISMSRRIGTKFREKINIR